MFKTIYLIPFYSPDPQISDIHRHRQQESFLPRQRRTSASATPVPATPHTLSQSSSLFGQSYLLPKPAPPNSAPPTAPSAPVRLSPTLQGEAGDTDTTAASLHRSLTSMCDRSSRFIKPAPRRSTMPVIRVIAATTQRHRHRRNRPPHPRSLSRRSPHACRRLSRTTRL